MKFASLLLAALLVGCANPLAAPLPQFQPSPHFGEQQRYELTSDGLRIFYNAPAGIAPAKPHRVIVFALPNGNSIEQSLGAKLAEGVDWRHDIQHIAAQARRLRELNQRENIYLVLVEAPGRSWPAWRAGRAEANARIGEVVEQIRSTFPAGARLEISAHSGGGSFIHGLVENGEIPDTVDRISYLDANYSFDAERHGPRFLRWLQGAAHRRLVVVAYDDRNITLDGKPVVGPTGGTWRASHRMIDFFAPAPLHEDASFVRFSGMDGRLALFLHRNPENRILHTRLVGEMNGFLMAQALGTPEEWLWGSFGGPRAYAPWVQAVPAQWTGQLGRASPP